MSDTQEPKRVPPPPAEAEIILPDHGRVAHHLANQEARAIANGDYTRAKEIGDHRRSERLKQAVHCIVVVGIFILGLSAVAGILCLSWHYLAPERMHFLQAAQIDTLFKLLTGGVVAKFAGEYVKRSGG